MTGLSPLSGLFTVTVQVMTADAPGARNPTTWPGTAELVSAVFTIVSPGDQHARTLVTTRPSGTRRVAGGLGQRRSRLAAARA